MLCKHGHFISLLEDEVMPDTWCMTLNHPDMGLNAINATYSCRSCGRTWRRTRHPSDPDPDDPCEWPGCSSRPCANVGLSEVFDTLLR